MDYQNYSTKWDNKKRSGKHFAHDYLEKPAIYAALPYIKGKKILCLGSGNGSECNKLLELGAARVIGLEKAKGLTEAAKYTYNNDKLEFITGDIDTFDYSKLNYDFVFSSLTLHYIKDWQKLFKNLKKNAKNNLQILFSAHHPIKWGALATRSKDQNSFVMGYTKFKNQDSNYQVAGDYLGFYKKKDKLFNELDIEFYHRSISKMFLDIKQSDYSVMDFLEPTPTLASKKLKPDFHAVYSKIPLFCIFFINGN